MINNKVKTYAGRGIVREVLPKLICGSHALIVTGARAAKVCGAYGDVAAVLDACGVKHTLYDKIKENPSVSSAFEGGQLARECGCDFVIGIGGGSALDAAKAAAAFAANLTLTEETVFTATIESALPIIAIPTTAGTGSEVNRYSVLTLDGGLKKRTYKDRCAYPIAALLDFDYTKTIPDSGAVSCALDAFSHCIESYLSPASTVESRKLAADGARDILSVIMCKSSSFDDLDREKLLYAASRGGAAIDVTGTGFTHPLGYSVTLSHGIPHGVACGMFLTDYVNYNLKANDGSRLLDEFFTFVGYEADAVTSRVAELSQTELTLTEAECEEYIDRVSGAANFKNSPYVISRDEMSDIYRRLFLRSI